MWHSFLKYLVRILPLNKEIHPDLPPLYCLRIIIRRCIWLAYGLKCLRFKAFIAPTAVLENGHHIKMGEWVTIEPYVRLNAVTREKVVLGNRIKIGAYSHVVGSPTLSQLGKSFTIGDNSACGEFCYFGAVGGITIGKNVIIGQHVTFHSQEHYYEDISCPIREQGTHEKGIVVGDNCWIGAKATILDGSVIGKHCVIAAGTVVKGEFPDYSVIAGVPAKIVKTLNG